MRECARNGHAVWALFGVQGQHEERGVVLEGEELERSGIVKGMDVVLLGEALDKRALEGAQVGDGQLEDLRRPLARHEERRLGVLRLLRLALGHGALGAGILGFSAVAVSIASRRTVAGGQTHTVFNMAARSWCCRCRTLGATKKLPNRAGAGERLPGVGASDKQRRARRGTSAIRRGNSVRGRQSM